MKTSLIKFLSAAACFALLFFFITAPASATPPAPKIPDWFESRAGFNNALEFGAIANVSCELKSLLFDITGRAECVLTDAAKPLAPLAPVHFNLKKGESASFKFPLHFDKETHSKPLAVKIFFDFPKKEMLAYVSAMNIDGEEKNALIEKIKSASDLYEITHSLDFIITKNESFSQLDKGVYDNYLKNGFLIKSFDFKNMELAAILSEIKRYEEFIATVRKTPELKTYLATGMDLVSSEDKYLNYLYAAAYHYYTAGDHSRAGFFFDALLDKAVKEAQNVDTSEIFVNAAVNKAVMLYELGKKKEFIELAEKLTDFCVKRSDARLRYIYYNIANYHRLASDIKAAETYYRRALALKPAFTACSNEIKKLEEKKQNDK
ncbi:MAG TPA: hypothetical protein PKW98_07285 [Candidatus Wallbacteria bacterium]|nr:MAG: hypothetical protein BWY32_00178 [bacterium ADurb.Bin243]HOD40055.1 hypothetical protein [Candidatus Wallbacteria bacterium]HPG57604.1 hypothetical protein [Candidatus Wallbacteria bacterium]